MNTRNSPSTKQKIINILYAAAKNEAMRKATTLELLLFAVIYIGPLYKEIPVFHISLKPAIAAMERNLPGDFELINKDSYNTFPYARHTDNNSSEIVLYDPNNGDKYSWPVNVPNTPATVTRILPKNPRELEIISGLRQCYTEIYTQSP